MSVNSHLNILVLYGSESGNTEKVAEHLCNKIKSIIAIKPVSANSVKIAELSEYDFCVFMMSTTGDGEFPSNAREFWKRLTKYKDEIDTYFCVVGFGDSNFKNFCKPAKLLKRRLKKLCKASFIDTWLVDDSLHTNEEIGEHLNAIAKYINGKIYKSKMPTIKHYLINK
jgi:flavodoxin